ncbi:MAG TPA: hypothetical protein VN969_36100 [Streptosporangiaceae bacterium]|nr:hypothetical protein [Streptosporangiaceae bacterium]
MRNVGPFSVHSSLNSYLEDLRDPMRIPVLEQADDGLREVADLSAGPLTQPGPEVPGVLVVAMAGSPAAVIGQALAGRCGGEFAQAQPAEVGAVIAAHPGAAHVILMGLGEEVDLTTVLAALGSLNDARRHEDQRAGLGIVTGPALSDLSWLIAKGLGFWLRHAPARSHLCVAPLGGAYTATCREVEWVTGDGTRRAALEPVLCAQHNGLVSFAAAGREHGMILTDTVVCGAVPERGTINGDVRAGPACAFSDRCFKNGIAVRDVISADRIRADVVCANTCMAWRPGQGLVAAEYQLTHAFLRGVAAAFIGAIHQMVPDIRLNDMLHSAAAAGMSVGQIAASLNEYLRRGGSELPYFAVLGLPWITPFPSPDPPGADDAIFDGTRRSRPRRTEDFSSRVAAAGQAIEGLRSFSLLGFMPPDDFFSLDAQVGALVSSLCKKSVVAVPAIAGVGELEKLQALIEKVEFRAAEDFHDFGQISDSGLYELWMDFLETQIKPVDQQCPYCASPLAELTGLHPVYPRIGRRALVCNVCGLVSDLPVTSAVRSIVIDCPRQWEQSGVVDIEVRLVPAETLTREIRVAGAVHTSASARQDISFSDAQRISLQPGAPAVLRAEAKLGQDALPHHEHFLRAVLIAQGMVHYASRPVAVRPQAFSQR